MAAVPHAGAHMEARFGLRFQLKSTKNVALHFGANAHSEPAKSTTYPTSTPANCRRWARTISAGYRSIRRGNIRGPHRLSPTAAPEPSVSTQPRPNSDIRLFSRHWSRCICARCDFTPDYVDVTA